MEYRLDEFAKISLAYVEELKIKQLVPGVVSSGWRVERQTNTTDLIPFFQQKQPMILE